MKLQWTSQSAANDDIRQFSQWALNIGYEVTDTHNDDEAEIEIPIYILVKSYIHPVFVIVESRNWAIFKIESRWHPLCKILMQFNECMISLISGIS